MKPATSIAKQIAAANATARVKALPSRFVAVVGGSGAGKSWLADRLQVLLAGHAGRLSLDDFYRDRSRVARARRDRINFDHPRAIDWPLFGKVLRSCEKGREVRLPRYDFGAHVRLARSDRWRPKPLVVVDGLWLLRQPALRRMFALRIYVDCAETVRLRQRQRRDLAERGRRDRRAVRRDFYSRVAPMHSRYVAPQMRWADIVVSQPPTQQETQLLADRLWALANQDLPHPGAAPLTFLVELKNLLKGKVSI